MSEFNEPLPPYFDEPLPPAAPCFGDCLEDDRVVFHVSGPKDAVVPILERCANGGIPAPPAMGPEDIMARAMSNLPSGGGMLGARRNTKSAVSLRFDSDWQDGRQVMIGSVTITDIESGEPRLEANFNMKMAKPPEPSEDEQPGPDPSDLPPVDESAPAASTEPPLH